VDEQRLQVQPAADGAHFFLLCEYRVPVKDLQAIEPAVLDNQKPS
jgi:hypothetical protein